MNEIVTLFPSFLLCLVRLSCFFFTAPIFSYKNMPAQFKIGLSCILAYLATVTLNDTTLVLNDAFILLVLKEAIVGLSMGFVAGVFFYAVQIAGTFIDLQMGLSMASVIDPESGMQTPLTGQLMYGFMILFLFTVDAHHMLIDGVLNSFQTLPLNQLSLGAAPGDLAHYLTQVFLSTFAAALQMSLPIVGSLFLVDVAVGMVARTVPQLNVFVVSPPLKIGVGFILLIIVIPLYITFFRYLFDQTTTIFQTFQSLLKG